MPLRRRHGTGLFATERAPRLVLRFAVVLSLALGLASAAILLVVHHFAITTAERAATRHAGLVASTVFQREVAASDLREPVGRLRAHELDDLFRQQLLTEDVLGVSLVRRDGTVTFSTDHAAIGSKVGSALPTEAASGSIVSRTARAPDGVETLETFAPVGAGIRKGAALITQSYAPIEREARAAQLRVGIVLEALLVLLVLLFIPMLARVTRKIEAQIAKIHQQAFYDGLTGLPNRTHLRERLAAAVMRAAKEDRGLAVLLVDLDRFREINETLGHEAGDSVLVETAGRLQELVGTELLLARFGSDEFVVVGELESTKAEAFAERLRAAVEPPIVLDGMPLTVDATVGMAFFPADGADAETLLKHSEIATHTAKQWRRGVLGYSPAVDPHDPEQLKLAAAVRTASERGEVRPHYQPKITLATNTIAGFEALAYWHHPTRGLLPPGAFIPVAERTGAIRHVTRAVLEHALDELGRWPCSDLTVAVNLTAIDLLDAEFPEYLAAALTSSHDIAPGRLWLELTETTVMADPERAQEVLERIVATGVRISIDDFGTGHSALAYLKDLPVGEVKIDRSFVSDMALSHSSRMIVKATVQLAQSLGLQVVAEGVEDAETHSALRRLGCDYAQGYLYGKPLSGDLVLEALERRQVEAA